MISILQMALCVQQRKWLAQVHVSAGAEPKNKKRTQASVTETFEFQSQWGPVF